MLSYILALVVALIFAANPISEYFYPKQTARTAPASNRKLSPRPRLNESLLAIDAPNATAPACPPDTYIARILNQEPLVVYLENFLSENERKHLLEISDPIFEPARIGSQDQQLDTTIRDSHVAVIPRTDPVRCIERRALSLQGWRRDVWIERLRTQRYDAPGGHYSHHYDWNANRGGAGGWGRVSSFMVWVDDAGGSVEGGGTEFPFLEGRSEDERWCRFVECADGKENDGEEDGGRIRGTTFKVAPGNAVYWENFAPDGRGYEQTWHAGLPVTKGTKVGLNIWTFGRIE